MDNARNKRSFEFDLADIPVLAHALSIECGTWLGYDRAKYARAKELHDLVVGQVPACSEHFAADDWQDFCRRISAGAAYEVVHRRRGLKWDSTEGEIVVRIGDKEWRSHRSDHAPEAAAIAELRAFLDEYGPMEPVAGPRP